MEQLWQRLRQASRPLVIGGGGGWSAQAKADLEAFAAAAKLPVSVSFCCQDYFVNKHTCFVAPASIGFDATLATRVPESDLIISFGASFGSLLSTRFLIM